MSKKIKISCLPVGGIENPYQFLMMEGLRLDNKFIVKHGMEGKFGAILKTVIIQKPDYIHFDWIHQYYLRRKKWMTWLMMPLFFIELVLVRRMLKIKLVWTLHNIMPHDQPTTGPYIWCRRFFAKQCDWIRVFSEVTIPRAEKVLRIPSEKIKVVPEGSYVGYYPNTVTKQEARKLLNLDEHKKVMLFFGSIKKYKGIENLISVFRELNLADWILVIAGKCLSTSYKEEIESVVGTSPNIMLKTDGVAVAEVQNYMNSCDLVVLPFRKVENSGSAILAMGFAKAIIAPNLGVLPERLMAQPNLLYDEDLNEVIKKLDSFSKSELEEFGKENYENLKLHGWEKFQIFFQSVPS